jgi:hypothetical protein
VGARRTPEGAKRSAAVEAKRRLVRTGSRGTIGPERGKLTQNVSAGMEQCAEVLPNRCILVDILC